MQTPALSPFWSQVLVGVASFNERFFSSNPDTKQGRRWSHFAARQIRYEVFWGHYEQNVYRAIHLWAETLKEDYQLYSNVRSIYSPAYRIGEFWSEHLYGGVLDCEAGDGVETKSAIPILTENEELRPCVAQVFRDSNWQAYKDVWTRFGAVLGDVGLMVYDDPDRQVVTLRVIHPRTIRRFDADAMGNCKGYILEEWRPDPRVDDPLTWPTEVRYIEVCTKVGQRVRYQTFLENEPWDWRDYPDESSQRVGPDWTEDYGFVPFVFTQHRDMGLGSGWSEYQPSLSKLMELDEIVSKLNDQIRKSVEPPWLMAGVAPADLTIVYPDPTDDEPEPNRTRVPIIYATDPNAKGQALVAPLDIAAVSAHATSILRELERDHPELIADDVAPSASGTARRIAQEKIEARVVSRRAGYDDALVRALMMAVSIGAMREYPGFENFTAESFDLGELKMSIGDRPVFSVDAMDHLEELKARADVLKVLIDAKVPLLSALDMVGYPKGTIEAVEAEKLADEQKAMQKAMDIAGAQGQNAVIGKRVANPLDGTGGVAPPGGSGYGGAAGGGEVNVQ